MDGEPELIRFFVGCAKNLLRFGRQIRHTLAPAWSGPDKDQLANEARRLAGDLLRDETTEEGRQLNRSVTFKVSFAPVGNASASTSNASAASPGN